MTYYIYVFHTNFDHMMHHLWDTTPWQVCDLELTSKEKYKVKGHKVNWKIIDNKGLNWTFLTLK